MLRGYLQKVALFIMGATPLALFSGNPINPGVPTAITTTNNVTAPTTTAGSGSVFLATWINTSNNLMMSLSSNDGSSWSAPTLVSGHAVTGSSPSICYGSEGFVIGWSSTSLTGSSMFPWVSFSNNNGASWTNISLANDQPGGNVVSVCAIQGGFVAVYTSNNSGDAYASFSSNGTAWGTPSFSQINTAAGSVNRSIPATVIGLGNALIGAWVDTSNNAQTSTTTISGGALNVWSSSVALTSGSTTDSRVSLATDGSVFMAAWVNTSGNAYSSYSINGSSWSSPSQIATGLNTDEQVNIGLTANSDGFVAAWQDSSNVLYASFSSNNGLSWSTKVEISSGLKTISASIPGVSLAGNECLFTWTSNTNNAFSNGSGVPISLTNVPRLSRRPNNKR